MTEKPPTVFRSAAFSTNEGCVPLAEVSVSARPRQINHRQTPKSSLFCAHPGVLQEDSASHSRNSSFRLPVPFPRSPPQVWQPSMVFLPRRENRVKAPHRHTKASPRPADGPVPVEAYRPTAFSMSRFQLVYSGFEEDMDTGRLRKWEWNGE